MTCPICGLKITPTMRRVKAAVVRHERDYHAGETLATVHLGCWTHMFWLATDDSTRQQMSAASERIRGA